jgi:hypothetical protein
MEILYIKVFKKYVRKANTIMEHRIWNHIKTQNPNIKGLINMLHPIDNSRKLNTGKL